MIPLRRRYYILWRIPPYGTSGHEHVSTTEIYTHISDDAIKKAAKASPLATFKKNKN